MIMRVWREKGGGGTWHTKKDVFHSLLVSDNLSRCVLHLVCVQMNEPEEKQRSAETPNTPLCRSVLMINDPAVDGQL